MKEKTILYTFLIIFISFLQINSQDNGLHFVYDYCMNGTADEVYLEDVEDNYIYLYNGFSCDYFIPLEKRGTYYFFLESDLDIINDKNELDYILLDKNWTSYEEIRQFKVKDLDFQPIKYLKKEKNSNNYYTFTYYYKIKKDSKITTIIFRLAKNGNEKGRLWMSSLENYTDNGIDEGSDSDYSQDNDTDHSINTDTDSNIKDNDDETDIPIIKPGNAFNLKFNYLLLIILLFI